MTDKFRRIKRYTSGFYEHLSLQDFTLVNRFTKDKISGVLDTKH